MYYLHKKLLVGTDCTGSCKSNFNIYVITKVHLYLNQMYHYTVERHCFEVQVINDIILKWPSIQVNVNFFLFVEYHLSLFLLVSSNHKLQCNMRPKFKNCLFAILRLRFFCVGRQVGILFYFSEPDIRYRHKLWKDYKNSEHTGNQNFTKTWNEPERKFRKKIN